MCIISIPRIVVTVVFMVVIILIIFTIVVVIIILIIVIVIMIIAIVIIITIISTVIIINIFIITRRFQEPIQRHFLRMSRAKRLLLNKSVENHLVFQ